MQWKKNCKHIVCICFWEYDTAKQLNNNAARKFTFQIVDDWAIDRLLLSPLDIVQSVQLSRVLSQSQFS